MTKQPQAIEKQRGDFGSSFVWLLVGVAVLFSLGYMIICRSRLAAAKQEHLRIELVEQVSEPGSKYDHSFYIDFMKSFCTAKFIVGLKKKLDSLQPDYAIISDVGRSDNFDPHYIIYLPPGQHQKLVVDVNLESGPVYDQMDSEKKSLVLDLAPGICHLLDIEEDDSTEEFQVLLDRKVIYRQDVKGGWPSGAGGKGWDTYVNRPGVLSHLPWPIQHVRNGRWIRAVRHGWSVDWDDRHTRVTITADLASTSETMFVPEVSIINTEWVDLFKEKKFKSKERSLGNGWYRVSRDDFDFPKQSRNEIDR